MISKSSGYTLLFYWRIKMTTEFYVYLWKDPKDDTPRYVGKGKNNRAWDHAKPHGSNKRVRNMIRKRRQAGHNPQPILYHCVDEQHALQMEMFWIYMFGREDLGSGTLFNLTDGGEHFKGVIHKKGQIPWNKGLPKEQQPGYQRKKSVEEIEKTRASRLANGGYVVSDEQKQAISEKLKGKPLGRPAWNRGKPAWNRGRQMSDEQKEKIGKANHLRWEEKRLPPTISG